MNYDKLIEMVNLTGHHPMGPSAAARWMHCPGSVALTIDIPDSGSVYAAEGTAAHTLAEICLSEKRDACEVEGYTEEMQAYVQEYVDYVRNIAGGLYIAVEQELDLSVAIPEGYGTADALIYDAPVLHVVDLKYGMRKVSAEDNPQLMIYAIGGLQRLRLNGLKPETVVMHIHQPRAGGPSSWEIPASDLWEFAKEVRASAELCMDDDAPLIPSEKACEWCRAKATCPALYEKNLEIVGGDFEMLPSVENMSDEQISVVLEHKGLIEKWLKAIEATVFSRLEHGESFPGFKMVEGRSIRRWSDKAEEKLVSILGNNAFEQKLIGITAAEKILGKKQLAELEITEKPEGKPVLAHESDKRPALATIADDFETVK